MTRIAVVLFNLGGPDGRDSVEPYLRNFFSDRNIIDLPWPFRQALARLIAARRSRREAAESYAALGWTSPLLRNSEAQALALEDRLNGGADGHDYKCFVCMRYWAPRADAVARRVADFGPGRIVLLPLYPQYSTATTRSSFQDWARAAKAAGLDMPAAAICCYPLDAGFIAASAARIRDVYDRAAAESLRKGFRPPRILFSAHGLPEKTVKAGDPYRWQCEETARAIAARLGIPALDWEICYQSRVGKLKWIGPGTAEALEKAGRDRAPVVIYPHAFVSEHVETLVEIGLEYRHLAETLGIPAFHVVETVGAHGDFIGGLADLVRVGMSAQRRSPGSCGGESRCGAGWKKCARRDPAMAGLPFPRHGFCGNGGTA